MLRESAQAFQSAYARRAATGFKLNAAQQLEINRQMARMEQALTDADGLPGRPWFKHFLHAPGMLNGYGVNPVPGVREARSKGGAGMTPIATRWSPPRCWTAIVRNWISSPHC